MLFEKVKSALVQILLIPNTSINSLDFTNSKDCIYSYGLYLLHVLNIYGVRAHWVRVIYYKPKEFLTMSKYLHLSSDMHSDIEVMLAKKFSFNRIACLSLHMYATDAKIETSAV